MAEHDSQPSKAEQRQLAVEKLKRATSLPRMKDGRRTPMHVEAVSESEKPSFDSTDGKSSSSQSPPLEDTLPPLEPASPPEEDQYNAEPEPDTEIQDRTISPAPPGRSKRRSRSRSRSRGSRDFKNKARGAQSPIPPAGDLSQEDEEPPIPTPPPVVSPAQPPLFSPLPHHLAALQHTYFARSPTPETSTLYPGYPSPTPMLLPTLEALQKGLFRSNSASNAAADRRRALAKLTGGTDIYDPLLATPSTPPPSNNKLSRNNTVSGGERIAARQNMLTLLSGRLAKEAEVEGSGSEERTAPSPTPRRRKRRSRRGSAGAHVGNIEFDCPTVSADTPIPPPHPPDSVGELRMLSVTPMQASSRNQSNERVGAAVDMMDAADSVDTGPTRSNRHWDSVLVEDDEIDNQDAIGDDLKLEQQEEEGTGQLLQPPSHHGHLGLPVTPRRFTPNVTVVRVPHPPDIPSQVSTDSEVVPGTTEAPFYFSHGTRSSSDTFPSSPFTIPFTERPSEEEEEKVLYHPDIYRARTPYTDIHTDGLGREISWVGEPVLDVNKNNDLVIESDSEDDRSRKEVAGGQDDDIPPITTEDSEDDEHAFEEPLSPTSSEAQQKDFSIPRESTNSVEQNDSNVLLPSSSSTSAITNLQSPEQLGISPSQLSAPRIQGSEKSPPTADDWEETSSSIKRNGETTSPSTWEKVKGAFARANPSGRRSRSNSLATRERRDKTESSISRESGASLTSTKAIDGPVHPSVQAPPLMQTPSASTSIHSLSPHGHIPPRSGASPIPPATSADWAKYQSMKLFPFPGIQRLEEQRNKKIAGVSAASLSSPDVSTGVVDEDQPPLSSNWYNSTPPHTPDTSRERTLSHQASDSKLLPKFNGSANGTSLSLSASHGQYIDVVSLQSLSHSGKTARPQLPKTLSGVRQWLTKNNNKLFPPSLPLTHPQSSSSSEVSNTTATVEPVNVEKTKNGHKKPSLSDLFKKPGSELTADWEEVGTTPISANGDYSFVSGSSNPPSSTTMAPTSTRAAASSSSSDSNEKTGPPFQLKDGRHNAKSLTNPARFPKAKNLTPLELQKPASLHIDESPSPLSNPPSRSDPLLSSTPDPSSSLSDYPRSTSESSSSSQCSFTPQGSHVIDKLEENLVRGSRNLPLASIIDDPPRRSVFTWSVYQVVNQRTVKDRFLFLFNDLLVIAKPKLSPHENLVDFKASSPGRLFIVKNAVLLKDIRFTPGRTDTTLKSPSLKEQPVKNPTIKNFVSQFAMDPEGAVKTLVMKYRILEDPRRLGRFIFHTVELDRARVGEYLSKKTHKQELDAYLNNFGFIGLRIDRALRAFLLSINVPMQNSSALDNLLYAFAGCWYDANARFVAYDRNMAGRLVLALVRLNMILHGDLAETPGPTGYPVEDFPLRDWINVVQRADRRQLLPIDLLEDLYDSIRQEKLCQARSDNASDSAVRLITVRKSVPCRLTYKSQSDPIILRIPAPDPNLTIHLFGKDLQFDPPVLSFTKSSEVSFRIIGNELGLKSMIMCRAGANALKYSGLPLSNTLVVERAFMRNTFQIAFTDHREMKRRYMFSVADPVLALSVRTSIERASSNVNSIPSTSSESNKFMRVAEQVAFRILQCTLIDGPDFVRSNKLPIQPVSGPSKYEMNGKANGFSYSKHGRSKSRSQLYRHDAGQNELDLSYDSASYSEFRDSDVSDVNEEVESPTGPLWSGEELVAQCQQNSTIPMILSLLQVGVLGKDTVHPL
ncbi:hypothetical protein AGABI1DRAFT_127073 [Agaricus bisporus var. burnettii JB137-S8]|uniref:SEC7 domain-containing protein n=1 Tax=Agaricus bisporus var. burnettii (strain JB137-S8 / ATCC MYA-4627 / FGSC 10392) TaxID=597362 RepID=K5WZR1_AGABU|nr:uncharacterized protein AGABI1DRAFT_127073 [Agaricus bisporus var. burnettii JB137-S8]EKM81031.1 hypothetical protein AGABI1DRAFT_127073 [Agaricus bisporus var. burnettii JB137-S8]